MAATKLRSVTLTRAGFSRGNPSIYKATLNPQPFNNMEIRVTIRRPPSQKLWSGFISTNRGVIPLATPRKTEGQVKKAAIKFLEGASDPLLSARLFLPQR